MLYMETVYINSYIYRNYTCVLSEHVKKTLIVCGWFNDILWVSSFGRVTVAYILFDVWKKIKVKKKRTNYNTHHHPLCVLCVYGGTHESVGRVCFTLTARVVFTHFFAVAVRTYLYVLNNTRALVQRGVYTLYIHNIIIMLYTFIRLLFVLPVKEHTAAEGKVILCLFSFTAPPHIGFFFFLFSLQLVFPVLFVHTWISTTTNDARCKYRTIGGPYGNSSSCWQNHDKRLFSIRFSGTKTILYFTILI